MNLINNFFEDYYKNMTYDELVKDFYFLERMANKISDSIAATFKNDNKDIASSEIRKSIIIKGKTYEEIADDYRKSRYDHLEEQLPVTTITVMVEGKSYDVKVTVKKDSTLGIPFGVKYDPEIIEQIIDYNQLIRGKVDVPKFNYYDELLRNFEK